MMKKALHKGLVVLGLSLTGSTLPVVCVQANSPDVPQFPDQDEITSFDSPTPDSIQRENSRQVKDLQIIDQQENDQQKNDQQDSSESCTTFSLKDDDLLPLAAKPYQASDQASDQNKDPNISPSRIGWQKLESGTVYYKPDGSKAKGWLKDKGVYYYLDPQSGLMQSGLLEIEGSVYYLDPDTGIMQKGMVDVPESKGICYFDAEGVRKTGWVRTDGTWYYFSPETYVRQSGMVKIDGASYYLNPEQSDAMHTGWKKEADGWALYGKDGPRQYGLIPWEGIRYFLDENTGIMQTGWQNIGGNWHYFVSDGPEKKGFLHLHGQNYYLDPLSGNMVTGWKKVDGTWYFFSTEGARKSGWLQEGKDLYYLDPASGALKTGTYQVQFASYTTNAAGAIIRTKLSNMHYMNQANGSWSAVTIHGSPISSSGCTGASLAMAINAVSGSSLSPADTCRVMGNAGLMNYAYPGAGGQGILYAAKTYGVPVRCLGSLAEMQMALKQGKAIVALMNPGSFAPSGATHAICVYGWNEGYTNVNDPLWSSHNGVYSSSTIWYQQSTDPDDRAVGVPIFALG